jgi:hypothetical protein
MSRPRRVVPILTALRPRRATGRPGPLPQSYCARCDGLMRVEPARRFCRLCGRDVDVEATPRAILTQLKIDRALAPVAYARG